MTFLITSLPRSMTAWCSAFFTTADSTCHHEPVTQVKDYEAWLYGVTDTDKHIGIADSSIPFAAEKYDTFFPDARVVVIQRDPQQVIDSYRKASGMYRTEVARIIEVAQRKLDEYVRDRELLMVKYDRLHDSLPIIWEYIFGGIVPYDAERAEIMKRLNITVPYKEAMKQMEQSGCVEFYKNNL